jgi:hypothetical protein
LLILAASLHRIRRVRLARRETFEDLPVFLRRFRRLDEAKNGSGKAGIGVDKLDKEGEGETVVGARVEGEVEVGTAGSEGRKGDGGGRGEGGTVEEKGNVARSCASQKSAIRAEGGKEAES